MAKKKHKWNKPFNEFTEKEMEEYCKEANIPYAIPQNKEVKRNSSHN